MPSISDLKETPRRVLHIFYVLDTSGSMEGTAVAMLNRSMRETTLILKQQAEKNADALIKVAVLEFNSGCRWIQPKGPESMDDFIWEDLSAGGLTDIGSALKELDSKLSRKEFLKSDTGAYLPVLIFMTDGYATDNYQAALEEIRKNKWFNRGCKIGFAIGENADVKMIADIVGNYEAVVKTEDFELFARLLKFATVTASMQCSRSRTSATDISGRDIMEDIKREAGIDGKDDVEPIPEDEDIFDDVFLDDDISDAEVFEDDSVDDEWN